MEHYKSIKKTKITRNIAQLSYQKVSVLYNYLKKFCSSTELDVRCSEGDKKVQSHFIVGKTEDDDEFPDEYTENIERSSYYIRSGQKQTES